MATTKKVANTKEKKVVNKKAEVVNKKAEVVEKVKEEKCECKCEDCKCNSTECLIKSMFYTLICILVFTAITAVFTIIIAVDYHNNGKNRNTNNSTSTTQNGGNGTGENGGNGENEYDVSMFTEITASQLIDLYNGSEKSLIYIGRPTCGYCVAFLPTLQQAQKELGYQTYYYDISNVTDDDYNNITGLNDFMANNFGYTPMVIVVQNGQILSADGSGEGWVGYSDYDSFVAYLQGLGY